jgi:hypothetical protein
MIKSIVFIFVLFITLNYSFCQFPIDSLLGSNQTPTYEETVSFYKGIAEDNEDIHVFQMGQTDSGLPIYLCLLNTEKSDSIAIFTEARESTTVLINNAIHPGEPCGVNASMQLTIDFSNRTEKEKQDYPIVAIVSAYNVGGMKNRGAYSRANQNGPELHGFRGNASNLDLNRDFVKMDSKNMFTFARIFHSLDPDIFVDTHTSNGADYQYTLTYITPVMEKLAPSIREIFQESMIPHLKREISKEWGYDLYPYINLKGRTPNDGMVKFNATPRYSMGYTDLFHTLSFTTETHMLKPFKDRVHSTYAFLLETIDFTHKHSVAIERARKEARTYDQELDEIPSNYELDTVPESTLFKGYVWKNEKSSITVGDRLKYDRDQPEEMTIPYYLNYHATDSLVIPSYYVIGGQASGVIDRLKANNIVMQRLEQDTVITLEHFKVIDYETTPHPYEGHYLHSNLKYKKIQKERALKKGDLLIYTDQKHRRFIVKLLSPEFVDSYFSWNFFDSYLQQKEHFSSYVFEDIAEDVLKNDEELKSRFASKKSTDESFAQSRYQQLLFIYRNSPHYENHGVLPVYSSID